MGIKWAGKPKTDVREAKILPSTGQNYHSRDVENPGLDDCNPTRFFDLPGGNRLNSATGKASFPPWRTANPAGLRPLRTGFPMNHPPESKTSPKWNLLLGLLSVIINSC